MDDLAVGERCHIFSRQGRVYQEHDLYRNCRNPGDTGCLEHSPGRLGLLGTDLPAFTPTHFVTDCSLGIYLRVDFHVPLLIKRKNRVGLRIRTFHPWRPNGHTGNRKPNYSRLLPEQTTDDFAGYVSFDHIVSHQSGVARADTWRHTISILNSVQLAACRSKCFDLKTLCL